MFQELTRMYISMCVYGKKEINRQNFDQELHISTHVYFMILTQTHTCCQRYLEKFIHPLSASISYTSYIHIAGKISVHLNYFSLRALNQWVVLKQRIQLLKTAWESAQERLLIIDSF